MTSLAKLIAAHHKGLTMPLGSHFRLAGLLMCCLLEGNTALAQTPEPTAIKYPDATASPAVKAAFTQALEKCQAELREDYASKMAKAVADGKPHLVAVYERRREATLVELCQLTAANAAADQRIAANKLAAADKLARNACGDGQRVAQAASALALDVPALRL